MGMSARLRQHQLTKLCRLVDTKSAETSIMSQGWKDKERKFKEENIIEADKECVILRNRRRGCGCWCPVVQCLSVQRRHDLAGTIMQTHPNRNRGVQRNGIASRFHKIPNKRENPKGQ